jgi:hypothetical protein
MFIRVGALLLFDSSGLYFAITAAGYPIPLNRFIGSDKPKKAKKEKSRKTPEKAKKKPEKKSKLPPINKLLPIILEIPGKLSRKLTVNEFYVNLTVGGDTFTAAMMSGLISELIGILLPIADKLIRIKRSHIVISPNFAAEHSELKFRGRISISIGALLRIALSALMKYLKIRKEMKNGQASSGRTDGNDDEENPRDGRREYHRGSAHSDA